MIPIPAARWLSSAVLLCLPVCALAQEPDVVRAAASRALVRVRQGAASYTTNRKCFSCHHQALPILAMAEGRRRGFDLAEAVESQIVFSRESFLPKVEKIAQGHDVGGASTTAGYALFTFESAAVPQDEVTDALVRFLLGRQQPDGSWKAVANRPPSEGSSFTATALAVRGLKHYGRVEPERSAKAAARAKSWLLGGKPETTEDRIFLLLGLAAAETAESDVAAARNAIIQEQHPDGGWAQLPSLDSDAYATGSALFALSQAGMPPQDAVYRRGILYLLKTQRQDGAWVVETRSKPIQTFFDNGDAGGKSQFISMAATGWAARALLEVLPVQKAEQ